MQLKKQAVLIYLDIGQAWVQEMAVVQIGKDYPFATIGFRNPRFFSPEQTEAGVDAIYCPAQYEDVLENDREVTDEKGEALVDVVALEEPAEEAPKRGPGRPPKEDPKE